MRERGLVSDNPPFPTPETLVVGNREKVVGIVI
jgi:hypothetical protein